MTRDDNAESYVPPVMQRDNERSRIAVDGRRTHDGDLCTLIAVHEVGGSWALFPHGDAQLGVRLAGVDAVRVARAILDGVP
ncbi:MAG: hypothetical protein ACRDTC_09485 [Pseudonocardiaceae bacterium]